MNLVEVWFGIIERPAIHRGTFTSVSELVGKICGLINELERPVPPVRLDQNLSFPSNRGGFFNGGWGC